jgi:hypothetical protein
VSSIGGALGELYFKWVSEKVVNEWGEWMRESKQWETATRPALTCAVHPAETYLGSVSELMIGTKCVISSKKRKK